MKHLPTHVLLDLAEDYNNILASIDAELLSRMPEGEFVMVYVTYGKNSGRCHYCNADALWGDATHAHGCPSLPDGIVGFEPVIGEDNEYLATERQLYDSAKWYETHDSSYF